jgi:putative phosphoribosyl transferase
MEQDVRIDLDGVTLDGILGISAEGKGVVIFAHGSGSSRLSPRNTFVARFLQQAGLGTLLFDLLTREEDADSERRFDIELLARRLLTVTRWLRGRPEGKERKLGYFGSSTGAAAALLAAAEMSGAIDAVVSRGGRPDLATPFLPQVAAPTLLIVGERDSAVLRLNRQALEFLTAEKELTLVPGATHLFEEPGALDRVAEIARNWFVKYLSE